MRCGTRREGGRHRSLPVDRAGLLALLENECERWRRVRVGLNRTASDRQEPALAPDLPTNVARLFQTACKAVWNLQVAVDKALMDLHPSREQRTALV